jgi:hypothetical protein
MPRNPLVDQFLLRVKHPQRGTIERIRDAILGVDDRIDEAIEPQGRGLSRFVDEPIVSARLRLTTAAPLFRQPPHRRPRPADLCCHPTFRT